MNEEAHDDDNGVGGGDGGSVDAKDGNTVGDE